MTEWLWTTILFSATLATAPVVAQQSESVGSLRKAPVAKRAGENRTEADADRRFEKTRPHIGETIPHVVAYDDSGSPLSLGKLRGHFTVLTFGCLT
jgi:hypothetical protein